jgi:type II secretory pathway pseudopilin PulG
MLPELLVAGLVFGLVAMASVQVLSGSGRAQALAADRSVAARMARSEIDIMRSLGPDRLAVDPGAPGRVDVFEGRSTVTAAGGTVVPESVVFVDGQRYEVERHVVWQAVGPEDLGYKRLVVVVRWPDGDVRLESGLREHADG